MSVYEPIRKLTAADSVHAFSCGEPALDLFLQRYALVNQQANSAQTYVCCKTAVITGFYSLTVGSVASTSTTPRVIKGLCRHPVPVMILARLAVDRAHQHKGVGKALLRDALFRTAQAADIVGIRALLVHAKSKAARDWYLGFDFEPSPSDPMHLFLLLKDFKGSIGSR